MGRWSYDWEITYYGSGCYIRRKTFRAKTREDALRMLREIGEKVIEIVCVRRTDKW